jgi:hypothetical protein
MAKRRNFEFWATGKKNAMGQNSQLGVWQFGAPKRGKYSQG